MNRVAKKELKKLNKNLRNQGEISIKKTKNGLEVSGDIIFILCPIIYFLLLSVNILNYENTTYCVLSCVFSEKYHTKINILCFVFDESLRSFYPGNKKRAVKPLFPLLLLLLTYLLLL